MINGFDVDFMTVTPWLMTSAGSCELAWLDLIWARIWSVLGSVLTSKLTVRDILPSLELSEYM